MKVVVNRCFGGFGLSEKAYEMLIGMGIPCRAYVEQARGEDGLYKKEPANEGEVIFDRTLTPNETLNDAMMTLSGRYWQSFIDEKFRSDPRLVKVVETLGQDADGHFAKLEVVEVPDGADYTIESYDGNEHIAERHRTW